MHSCALFKTHFVSEPGRDWRATGAMAEPKEIKILQPDDFHHHFRDEPFLEHTVIFG